MHTHNKKYRINKGRWWVGDENSPYVKYRHYHRDRKTKCTQQQQQQQQQK